MPIKKHNVTVLMATLNGEKYIEEQLISIVNQKDVNLKICIRDDGSKDGTINIIKSYSESYPIILLAGGKRSGSAAANFFELLDKTDISGADFIALADQDDVWSPNKLKDAIEAMGSNYSGCSSNLLAYDERTHKAWYIVKSNRMVDFDYLFQGGSAGCTYVIRSSFVNVLREQLCELTEYERINASHDWLIYLVARAKGDGWLLSKSCNIFYRQHSGNAYGDNGFIGGISKKIKLIKSGWYEKNLEMNAKLVRNLPVESMIYEIISANSFFVRLRILPYFLNLRRNKFHSIFLVLFILFRGFDLNP